VDYSRIPTQQVITSQQARKLSPDIQDENLSTFKISPNPTNSHD
jgi:hypothetical protein